MANRAAPWGELPQANAAAWARVNQDVLPKLEARRVAAERRVEARKGYFAGKRPLGAAFPHLLGTGLNDRAVLVGRLAWLDKHAEGRALDRVTPMPVLGSVARKQKLSVALARTLDAEEAAEALERRLLHALKALVEAHPALEASRVSPLRKALLAQVEAARVQAASEDPETAAAGAALAAAADAQRTRLDTVVRQIRKLATVPGADPPTPDVELEALRGEWSAQARERLQLMRPFLTPKDRTRVNDAESTWLQSERLEALEAEKAAAAAAVEAAANSVPDASLETLTAAVVALQGELEAARAAAEAIGGQGPLPKARRAVAEAEAEVVELRLAAAQKRVEAAKNAAKVVNAAQAADKAQAEAQQSRQRAEEALKEAQDAEEQRVAEVLEGLATAQQRTTNVLTRLKQVEQELATPIQVDVLDLKRKTQQVFGPISATRPRADVVYREVQDALKVLHAAAANRIVEKESAEAEYQAALERVRRERERTELERTTVQSLHTRQARHDVHRALLQWDNALSTELRAHERLVEVREQSRREALRQVMTARDLRRRLSGEVSGTVRRTYVVESVRQEGGLSWPMLSSQIRNEAGYVADLPDAAYHDANVVVRVVQGLLVSILLLMGWYYLRKRAEPLSKQILLAIRRGAVTLRPVELAALKEPVFAALLPFIDIVFAYLLYWQVDGISSLFALFFQLAFTIAVYRFLIAAFDLVVVPHPQQRPALRVYSVKTWQLSRWTLQVVLIWWIARLAALYFLANVMHMDTINGVVSALFWLAALPLLVWVLDRWEPVVREAMQHRDTDNALVGFVAWDGQRVMRPIRAGAGFAFFGLALGWDLVHFTAGRLEGVGRLLNVLSRYQLAQSEETKQAVTPIADEVRDKIVSAKPPPGGYVARPGADDRIRAALDVWRAKRRKGLIAFVGHRGDGKRTTMDALAESQESGDLKVRRWTLDERLTTTAQMTRWLGERMGVPDAPDLDALVAAAKESEGTLTIIEETHLVFLRTVGGFQALRALLYVLNGASAEHFWIVSMHKPSWDYLSRLGSLINTGVFQEVVVLPPMGEVQVRELATRRLQQTGCTPDFTPLIRPHLLGGDAEVELERTVTVFYRLLAEASLGNPLVALRMYADCLSRTADARVFEVHMHDSLTAATLSGVSDAELFLLGALYTQERLSEKELVEVTNMSPSVVRTGVKHLEQLALVSRDDNGRAALAIDALPTVIRTLRRRRFLSWAA